MVSEEDDERPEDLLAFLVVDNLGVVAGAPTARFEELKVGPPSLSVSSEHERRTRQKTSPMMDLTKVRYQDSQIELACISPILPLASLQGGEYETLVVDQSSEDAMVALGLVVVPSDKMVPLVNLRRMAVKAHKDGVRSLTRFMVSQTLKNFGAKYFVAIERLDAPDTRKRLLLNEVFRAEPDFLLAPGPYCSLDIEVSTATNRFVENARGVIFVKVRSLFTNSQHLPDTAYVQAELVSMVDPIVEFTEFFEQLPCKRNLSYMDSFRQKRTDLLGDREQSPLVGSPSPERSNSPDRQGTVRKLRGKTQIFRNEIIEYEMNEIANFLTRFHFDKLKLSIYNHTGAEGSGDDTLIAQGQIALKDLSWQK